MEFRILGPLEAVAGGRVVTPDAAKPRALLAILLLHANEPVGSDRLVEALWAGRPPPTAPKVLQTYVSQLRKALGSDAIVTGPAGYELCVAPGGLDLHRFEHLVTEARGAEPRAAAQSLREALSLWRGPPLVEFTYESWAQDEIGRLRELHLSALQDRIDADLALGRDGELVGELECLVAEHPLSEHLRRPADARPLPLGQAGRGPGGLPGGAGDARRDARDRAGSAAAAARARDPRAGSGPGRLSGVAAIDVVRRPRARAAGGAGAPVSRRRSSPHSHRGGWNGQDAPRRRGDGRPRRHVPGRRRAGRARPGRRRRPRSGRDRPNARSGRAAGEGPDGGTGRLLPRPAGAARARQLRAGARSGAAARGAGGGCARADAPRHEPRGARHLRGDGLPRRGAGASRLVSSHAGGPSPAGGGGAAVRGSRARTPGTTSSSPRPTPTRSPSSAGAWTGCRSHSSSRPRGSSCSRRPRSSCASPGAASS